MATPTPQDQFQSGVSDGTKGHPATGADFVMEVSMDNAQESPDSQGAGEGTQEYSPTLSATSQDKSTKNSDKTGGSSEVDTPVETPMDIVHAPTAQGRPLDLSGNVGDIPAESSVSISIHGQYMGMSAVTKHPLAPGDGEYTHTAEQHSPSKVSQCKKARLTPTAPPKRLAERMRDKSTLIDRKSRIYKLPIKRGGTIKVGSQIARCYVGSRPSTRVAEKVLMVVGATGAGKSTLINGMVNYLLGVRWEDSFRFKLIVEETATQAHSVTQWITAYTIYHQEGSPVPYTLTIIDTPGFGDTGGLEKDKKITTQIKEFFSIVPTQGGIDQLDGIGFVTQASHARLTHTQRYIFDSILSTFGKDIGNNIFMLVTFADGKKPPVVDAIKAAKIPHRKYFKFNNSALFPKVEDDDEEEGGDFDKMFWEMGVRSFENFFSNFYLVESRSLLLTREVLEERHQLETAISGLLPQIDLGLAKIDELQQEQRILEEHEKDITTNKDFTYRITVTKQRMVRLPSNTYVTNCLTCNHTCHYPCGIPNNDGKRGCAAMNNGSCTACPGRCHWTRHVNNEYRFELYKDEEERTSEELKMKYNKALECKSQKESMISTIESYLSDVDKLVMGMIRQVQRSLVRLDEIALKPNPLSEVEYIDLLITSEQQEKKGGWNQRVQYLQNARKQAQIQAGIRTVHDPEQEAAERQTLWTKIKGWWNAGVQKVFT